MLLQVTNTLTEVDMLVLCSRLQGDVITSISFIH